jgi:putative spermidine/putrescine transport system permease protein
MEPKGMRRVVDDVFTGLFVFILLIAAAFLIVPVGMTTLMSFDGRDFLGRFPPPDYSLRWYENFIRDGYFMGGLVNSIIVALVAALGAATAGVSAAVILDRYRFRGRHLLVAFFMSPLVVPTVVLGFAVLVFASLVGVTDGFTRMIGGHIILTVPYTIRTTLASLTGIKASLVEAALILGANEGQAFREITFPLAKTGIVAGIVLAFALSFEEVSLSLFLADPHSYTLPVALLGTMRSQFNLAIAAASVLIMLFTAVLVLVLERLYGLDRVIGSGLYKS